MYTGDFPLYFIAYILKNCVSIQSPLTTDAIAGAGSQLHGSTEFQQFKITH